MVSGTRHILTVGRFDGVHLGHQALLQTAQERARTAAGKVPVAALAFSRHPLTTLQPDRAPASLSQLQQREKWLREAGADQVHWLEPDAAFLAQTPQEFVESQVRRFQPLAWIEGPDFRFGCNRSGDLKLLGELGQRFGFSVETIEPLQRTLSSGCRATVSSSLIRNLVAEGRVREAAEALGRPYQVMGAVGRGEQVGRKLGFPTINVETGDQLLPADGVYGGQARVAGKTFTAAISVGRKPTFGSSRRLFEAHLLLGSGDWYGQEAEVELHHWIRDQAHYGSAEELVRQIHRDVEQIHFLAGAAPAAPAPGQPEPCNP